MPNNSRQSFPSAIAPLALLVFLLVFALVPAALLSPWMRAGTHPLEVKASVPAGATLNAELADGWKTQLVPVGEDLYATELPPRKSYSLSLRSEGGDSSYHSAEVLDLGIRPVAALPLPRADPPVPIPSGGSLKLAENLSAGSDFSGAAVGLRALLVLLVFGVAALWRRNEAGTADKAPHPSLHAWQWAFLLTLAAGEVAFIASANPLFWSADSIGYTSKALSLYQHGVYDTGGIFQEILRAPGVPLFEAAAWKLFGFSFESLALAQAILYAGACLLALAAFAKAVSRRAALVAAPFLFFAPAAVVGNRIMASEGLFASFALLVSAALLFAHVSTGRRRILWLLAASAFAAYSVLVRANGVALLAFPLFLLGRAFMQALREKSVTPVREHVSFLLPVAACLGMLLVWSARNYVVHDYFAPTDIGGLSMAEACFKGGILDIRASADDEALYRDIVKRRHETGYNFEAWSLSHLYGSREEAKGPLSRASDRIVDEKLSAFAARSRAAAPFGAKAAAFTRLIDWGVYQKRDANFQPYGLQDFRFVTYPQADWDYTNSVITGWIHKDLAIAQVPPHAAQRAFNALMPAHARLYTTAAGLGLFLFAFAAWRGHMATLALLLPYYGNILLNGVLGVIVARYVTVLEPLLILGLAAGVCEVFSNWRWMTFSGWLRTCKQRLGISNISAA